MSSKQEVQSVHINKLDKGYVITSQASSLSLNSAVLRSAACQTVEEIIAEVYGMLGAPKKVDAVKTLTIPVAPLSQIPESDEAEPKTSAQEAEPETSAQEAEPETEEWTPGAEVTTENRAEVITWLKGQDQRIKKGSRNTTLAKMVEECLSASTEEPAAKVAEVVDAVCPLCQGTGKLPFNTDCPHCKVLDLESVRMACNACLHHIAEADPEAPARLRTALGEALKTKFHVRSMREYLVVGSDWAAVWAALSEALEATPAKEEADEWEI